MTKREHNAETKRQIHACESRSAYRRTRGHVETVDALAKRRAGRIAYHAALRAIGVGRGSSAARDLVYHYELG